MIPNLDRWQKEVLQTKGNICLCSGRQVGKSTIVAIKAGEFAMQNPKKSVLIISSTERQAEELFVKVMNYIQDKNMNAIITKGKKRPTKRIMNLVNGAIIRCLPTGLTGAGIRGYTINLLIADEAAFIPEEVWLAVTPMLLTTGGDIILVSTPHGRKGYFYERYHDESFNTFHINSEEAILNRELCSSWNIFQKEKAVEFLDREKNRMTKRQYAQEYLGEFVDDIAQFFPDELIKKCMNAKRRDRIYENRVYFLGVDVARMGEDESTFEIIDRTDRKKLIHVENIITKKTRLNETTNLIINLENKYKFRKIYIDDGGLGVGVFDYLLEKDETKRKVEPINNRSRPLDNDGKSKKKILKDDLYFNLLGLMERGEISLLEDEEVFMSLKSVQYEYSTEERSVTKMKIYGSYTHIVEGIIRSAWCARDKKLNIYCY